MNGRLEPALIQKIVRANFDGMRKCYEAGLARNARLEGRVATRFVIEQDGTVSDAVPVSDPAVGSTGPGDVPLPDAEVTACVAARLKMLRFPEPNGGIVRVVYPIVFHPGN
ncbi:hypothetical protein AKJ09_08665 [Labilithrix luteola]|uniref:TonB C-terminal domain-containing protein n=1 Tax=Labilithrix luteola TaxID=1391654 RepID=A0A0K1Q8K6_9BACT|nr:AgmX/PglI C-terminal domain-containing protein [Labilithrix luteola]AKV02002.1 hypothetical protein AKJ09_08665 [Labilithrix luteola]